MTLGRMTYGRMKLERKAFYVTTFRTCYLA
jgi:hypothetical protein